MAASRVAIAGAGLAGLAAGIELTGAGCDVEIYERSRLLGGRATSFVVDGIEVDNGQHVFLGCCSEFLDFVKRAGMADCVRMQERFDALVLSRDGVRSRLRAASLPSPWHLLGSFIGYRHLAWPSKLRVVHALGAAGDARRSKGSFAEWLSRRGQTEEAMRSFWRPFFVPALNAPLEDVSAADAAFVLSTAFLSDASAARFGFATVPLAHVAQRAAAKLSRTHLSSPVGSLSLSRDGASARGLVLTSGEMVPFDAVVLAVPPPALARIVANAASIGLPSLDGYVPYPIIDVHLWHDRGQLGFDFAAVLDSPLQWIFEKGPGYLCCSMSAAAQYLTMPADQLAAECWREVVAALPSLKTATLIRNVVTRNPEATYLPSAAQRRPGPHTGLRNVAIAGSWTDTGWPDTMESAVRSGYAAARCITAMLRGAQVA